MNNCIVFIVQVLLHCFAIVAQSQEACVDADDKVSCISTNLQDSACQCVWLEDSTDTPQSVNTMNPGAYTTISSNVATAEATFHTTTNANGVLPTSVTILSHSTTSKTHTQVPKTAEPTPKIAAPPSSALTTSLPSSTVSTNLLARTPTHTIAPTTAPLPPPNPSPGRSPAPSPALTPPCSSITHAALCSSGRCSGGVCQHNGVSCACAAVCARDNCQGVCSTGSACVRDGTFCTCRLIRAKRSELFALVKRQASGRCEQQCASVALASTTDSRGVELWIIAVAIVAGLCCVGALIAAIIYVRKRHQSDSSGPSDAINNSSLEKQYSDLSVQTPSRYGAVPVAHVSADDDYLDVAGFRAVEQEILGERQLKNDYLQ